MISLFGRRVALLVLPLFAVHEALWVAHGMRTGGLLYDASASPLGRLDGFVFGAAYLSILLALLALARALGGRRRTLGWTEALACAGAASGLVAGVGTIMATASWLAFGAPTAGALSVATLAMFLSAFLVGAAHLRPRVVPRVVAVAVLLFGVLTIPLAIVLPMLVGDLVPEYVPYEAHFLFAGALWVVIGVYAGRRPSTSSVPVAV